MLQEKKGNQTPAKKCFQTQSQSVTQICFSIRNDRIIKKKKQAGGFVGRFKVVITAAVT